MAQNHNADFTEKPMTTYGRTQSPSRRYRRLRHPTFPAAEWASKNPLLQRGEIGVESDTHKVKVGDGLTYWNSLQYVAADADGQQKSTADYSMGNSSGGWTVMSTAQQNALNSGATTTNITQIGTNTTSIGNHIADTANPHQVTASQVGLGNVDNTSDADKPISTATQSALDGKQDTLTAGTNINITGSTISATDTTYTGSDGVTLTGTNFTNSGVRSVSSGTANGTISVNTNGTSADVAVTGLGSAAYTNSSAYATVAQGTKADTAVQPGDLATVATTGSYTDLLNKPTIPAAQVNSDWNANSGVAQILNKPTLATVATSGAYSDLTGTPSLATVATTGLYSDLTGTPSLAAVATSGAYSDLTGTPTIPAAQVNSDWDANSGVAEILNKPTTLSGYGITDGANTDLSNVTATGKETVVDLLTPDYTAGIDITSQVTGSGYTVLKDGIIYYYTMPATNAIDITVNGVYIMRKGSTSGNYSVSGSVIVKKNDVFWMGLVSGGSVYFYPFKGV